jgi:hypothetical protein
MYRHLVARGVTYENLLKLNVESSFLIDIYRLL